MLKGERAELERRHLRGTCLPIKLAQPLKMSKGIVVRRVALQGQTDEDLRGIVLPVPGKQQRESLQFGDSAVVVPKPKQVHAKRIDLRSVSAIRFFLRTTLGSAARSSISVASKATTNDRGLWGKGMGQLSLKRAPSRLGNQACQRAALRRKTRRACKTTPFIPTPDCTRTK